MKRRHILARPTAVSDIDQMIEDDYGKERTSKAERAELRRWRKVKQQVA
jgi:hypothetical protein